MLPQDLIGKKWTNCKDDVVNSVQISLCSSLIDAFWSQITRECKSMQSRPVWKTWRPKYNEAESVADLWSHSLIRSGHFNPISSEEITLLLVRCPAAEAMQMSPNGTGINSPFDYCCYFASGPCSFITHPDRRNRRRDSALLRPSEIKGA